MLEKFFLVKIGSRALFTEGFARGFLVLSDESVFNYKCTNFYAPEYDGGVIWNNPDFNICSKEVLL